VGVTLPIFNAVGNIASKFGCIMLDDPKVIAEIMSRKIVG